MSGLCNEGVQTLSELHEGPGDGIGSEIYAAISRRDWDRATDLVARHWALLAGSRMDLIATVADSLPAEHLDSRPHWGHIRAWVRHRLLPPHLRPQVLVLDEQAGHGVGGIASSSLLALSARSRGWFDASSRWADRARTEFATATPAERGAMRSAAGEMHYQWALSYFFADRMQDAVVCSSAGFDLAIGVGDLRIARASASVRALIAALMGDGARADQWLARAESRRAGSAEVPVPLATLARAVRQCDALDVEAAAATLSSLERAGADEFALVAACVSTFVQARRPESKPCIELSRLELAVAAAGAGHTASRLYQALVPMARAELHLMTGQLDRAVHALSAAASSGAQLQLFSFRAILALHDDDLAAARQLAYAALEISPDRPREAVAAHAVLAIVSYRSGDHAGASASFRHAIDHAADARILAVFALLPAVDLRVLMVAVGCGHMPQLPMLLAGVRRLELCGTSTLTAAEDQVARLLTEDVSFGAIARTLNVSENTVKTHRRAIYRKLRVGSRAEFAIEIRKRGLLAQQS